MGEERSLMSGKSFGLLNIMSNADHEHEYWTRLRATPHARLVLVINCYHGRRAFRGISSSRHSLYPVWDIRLIHLITLHSSLPQVSGPLKLNGRICKTSGTSTKMSGE